MSSAIAGPSRATKKKHTTARSSTKKSKEKESVVDAAEASADPTYEGTNTGWEYEPPKDAVLANHDVDAEEFDYDALKEDDNLELWIVRVPNAVKPKHLEALQIDAPSSTVTGRIGTFQRRDVHYDVWSLGNDNNDRVGGEELKSLTCLVPRKKKGGKLYAVPSIATHHILISAQPTLPTPPEPSADVDDSSSEPAPVTYTNPPRPSYPVEALKHMFMPLGSLARTSDTGIEDMKTHMDQAPVEAAESIEEEPVVKKEKDKKKKDKKREEGSTDEVKPKKRKMDASNTSPKRPKKAKRESA